MMLIKKIPLRSSGHYNITKPLPDKSKFKHIFFIKEISSKNKLEIYYKKTEPRPIDGFTLESYFNENIAMDIKEISGHKVLHLIDHATRFSVRVRIPSKESSDIINAIFKH